MYFTHFLSFHAYSHYPNLLLCDFVPGLLEVVSLLSVISILMHHTQLHANCHVSEYIYCQPQALEL